MTKAQKQAKVIKALAINYSVMCEKLSEENLNSYKVWKSIVQDDLAELASLGIKVEFMGINDY
jgi:hypothetical protein